MSDPALRDLVTQRLRQDVYQRIRSDSDATMNSSMIPPPGATA